MFTLKQAAKDQGSGNVIFILGMFTLFYALHTYQSIHLCLIALFPCLSIYPSIHTILKYIQHVICHKNSNTCWIFHHIQSLNRWADEISQFLFFFCLPFNSIHIISILFLSNAFKNVDLVTTDLPSKDEMCLTCCWLLQIALLSYPISVNGRFLVLCM